MFRVRESRISCDSGGDGVRANTGRERVLAVRNCLNREYLRAPFWPLEVMGSCPLRCPKVGDWRADHGMGNCLTGGGCQSMEQDVRMPSRSVLPGRGVRGRVQGPWCMWFLLPSQGCWRDMHRLSPSCLPASGTS